MATVTIVPEDDVIAKVTACRIAVEEADDTDSSTYDTNDIPREEAIPMRFVASHDDGDHDDLVSHAFVASADGDHVWDNVIFPVDGAWTVTLIDQRDDSTVDTLAVEVTT